MKKHLEYIVPLAMMVLSVVILILTKDLSTVKVFKKLYDVQDVIDIIVVALFFSGGVFLICTVFKWFEGLDRRSFFLGRTRVNQPCLKATTNK